MKKYYRIAIVFLVLIGIVVVPMSANAMTTKDMAGKVYQVTETESYDDSNAIVQQAKADDQDMGPQTYYLFTGRKGHCYCLNAENNEKKIEKMLSNKKYAQKQIKKYGVKYSINNNLFDMWESNAMADDNEDDDDLFTINPNNCDPIQQTSETNFSVHANPSRGLRNLGITGTDYTFNLAAQQYKFKW